MKRQGAGSREQGSAKEHSLAEKPRILIADDEQSMREWMRLLFQRDGFEVLTAEDGMSARDMIAREYTQAAQAYEKYLEQYPNSKNAYEYSYSYAETLYYSGRFYDAGKQYEKVRDSGLDNKYQEDAAFNAIKSFVYFFAYSDPTLWNATGFPGPWPGRVDVPVAIPRVDFGEIA